MNQCQRARQRTSATAREPAERVHTHTATIEKSTANHRPAANMLGQPGQSLHIPYQQQTVYRATHRCVSHPLSQHVYGVILLASVSAKATQQLQEIKCFELHAVKLLYKVCRQEREITGLEVSIIYLSLCFRGREGRCLFWKGKTAFGKCLRQ